MNGLLFFVLGLIIGGLSVATIIQHFEIREMKKEIKK